MERKAWHCRCEDISRPQTRRSAQEPQGLRFSSTVGKVDQIEDGIANFVMAGRGGPGGAALGVCALQIEPDLLTTTANTRVIDLIGPEASTDIDDVGVAGQTSSGRIS